MPFARLSRIFVPQNLTHSTARIEFENVHQLLETFGFIRHCAGAGLYHFLPLGHRVLDKVVRLIDEHMTTPDLAAQRIRMPSIVPSSLWKATGRLEACGSELLKFADRHGREMVLNPTHEESITHLVARVEKQSLRNFPLRLYQITSKFRDEMKPRFGLMRAREFLMKDLYSFDVDDESARLTYNGIRGAYRNLFRAMGVPFVEVAGDSGTIGGAMSHEFHIVAEVGEDNLQICRRCSQGYNSELKHNEGSSDTCVDTQKHVWESRKGIEVGHAFLLGERYSAPLKATYRTTDGKTANLVMGCYGLGVSRLVSAVLEGAAGDRLVGTGDEAFLRWPLRLAPYLVMLIPPKAGSKENKLGPESLLEFVGSSLVKSGIVNGEDIIIDDRTDQTIGKRLLNARRLGVPLVVIAGKASAADVPKFEVVDFTGGSDPKSEFLTALEVKTILERKLRSL